MTASIAATDLLAILQRTRESISEIQEARAARDWPAAAGCGLGSLQCIEAELDHMLRTALGGAAIPVDDDRQPEPSPEEMERRKRLVVEAKHAVQHKVREGT